MFCEKCGGELRQDKKLLVCQKCGAQYGLDYSEGYSADYSVGGERAAPCGFSSKKNIIIIVIAALVVLGGIGAAVAFGVSNHASQPALTGFQLAEKYLSEQNYEQAIIAFEQILEIEPMNVDAYLGLAEAYLGTGETEKALEVLREGLEITGDSRIQDKIDELTKPQEPPVSSGTSSVTSSEPVESELPIIYDDAESLAIEEMIEAYLRGEGGIDTSKLKNVTELEIYGTEVVCVACGNRNGTEASVRSHGHEEITIRTRNGDMQISRGSIDNVNEDLRFIFDIPLLKHLSINFNQISDITPLAGLTNLTYLKLFGNQISDITPLAGLTNLTDLWLERNQINDITPLAGLTNLTRLGLYHNQISDITPLAGLTNLTCLVLQLNQISDTTPLAGLTNLTILNLVDNQINDITPLARLTNLETLYLRQNQISDVKPLAALTNLRNLELWNNQINDITPLAGLTNLTRLGLYHNQISDITPLVGLTNLTRLDLGGNQINDITPLAGLANLTRLELYYNQISDITPLAGLTNLTNLSLFNNQISEADKAWLGEQLPGCNIDF